MPGPGQRAEACRGGEPAAGNGYRGGELGAGHALVLALGPSFAQAVPSPGGGQGGRSRHDYRSGGEMAEPGRGMADLRRGPDGRDAG